MIHRGQQAQDRAKNLGTTGFFSIWNWLATLAKCQVLSGKCRVIKTARKTLIELGKTNEVSGVGLIVRKSIEKGLAAGNSAGAKTKLIDPTRHLTLGAENP
ncbi:MAG TPA: hypothetical protein GX517_00555 [Alicyclobacillus sp.]|nr:hypothetical protein [Alicyclobacillus sp.]